MFDVSQTMGMLSQVRPVFYSEADFQHGLAWQIHLQNPACRVRLECPLSPEQETDRYLDILLFDGNSEIAIELKYKTSDFFAPLGGELFLLKKQGAQDQAQYQYLRDLQRLEEYVTGKPNALGYAIFLTNDSLYWNPGRNHSTVCDDFRITEGRRISGKLDWGINAALGTKKGMESPIVLKGVYECNWWEYSHIKPHEYVKGHTRFRYLVLRAAIKPN